MPYSFPSRLLTVSTLVLGAAIWCVPAMGQDQPQQDRGGSDQERQQRIEQFRQQMDTRMKEVLRASDEEYAVLKPRIEKIQQLQRANDTRRAAYTMMTSNSSWRTRSSSPAEGQRQPNTGQNAEANAEQPQRRSPFGETPTTPVTVKTQEMQAVLEAKDAGNDALKAKLAELRAAKQQSKQEVAGLQGELRGLCSIRQESMLVMLGILE